MAKKAMEMTIEIAGKVGSSLGTSFKRATGEIDDLKKRSFAAQRELGRLGREFSKGNIHQSQYALETKKVRSELRKLQGDMRRVNAISSTLSNGISKAKAMAKVAVAGTAVATAVAVGSSIKVAASYEAQMSKVGAVSGATKKELAKMDDFALELAKSSVFTATQAGEGMEYLALAGWKSKEIMAGMPGMLNLAAAGNLDLGRAADITSDTMSAFGMKAMEAGHAADVFAYAQANANTNVEQMGEMMKYSAPIANQMKWSLEETGAAAMVMADSGLKGSIAGQAFASSVSRLSKPTSQMSKKMKELNIEFFDADEKMKSMPDVIASLEKGFKGLSDKQRSSALTTLFGAEAYKHWAILLEGGSEKLRGLTKDLETADGAAAKMSAEMIDNYDGALKLLKASIETAQIKFMKPILPVFQGMFDGLGGMLDGKTGEIEAFGERAAKALSDILEPFSLKKPEMLVGVKYSHEELKEYQEELKQFYEREAFFKDMDVGDKIIYALDTGLEKAEEWLGGSGGEAMGRIFSKLGEIAAKSWWSAFKGSVGGSLKSLSEGNIGGALGLGAAAWMLGGGIAVKGAVGAGRWAMESRNVKKTTAAAGNANQTAIAPSSKTKKQKNNKKNKATAQPPTQKKSKSKSKQTSKAPSASIVKNKGKTVMGNGKNLIGKVAKVGSKAMLPLALAAEAVNIARSKDKVKAGGEAAGGIAGGAGGAKLGAAIGTAIAPGVGTAIGGLLGGAVGYIGGKVAGGKVVDSARGNSTTPTPPTSQGQAFNAPELNASAAALTATLETTNTNLTALSSNTALTAQGMSVLTMYVGQASGTMVGSFTALQTEASQAAANITTLSSDSALTAQGMSVLTMYVGQASGMIYGSFNPLQSNTSVAAESMSILTTYIGQASGMMYGSFFPLQSNASIAANSMSILVSYIGQASGWIASLQGIQSAGQRVISALNNLETRINNVPLPGGSSKRVSFDG